MYAIPVIVWLAAATALLLQAGVAKFVKPTPLARALAELVGQRRVPVSVVRLFAGTEVALALLLVLARDGRLVLLAVAAVGLSFIVVGAAGKIRATDLPCGCFGTSAGRPFGWSNVAAGVALLSAVGVAAFNPIPPGSRVVVLLLALISITAAPCLQHRRYIALFFNVAAGYRSAS